MEEGWPRSGSSFSLVLQTYDCEIVTVVQKKTAIAVAAIAVMAQIVRVVRTSELTGCLHEVVWRFRERLA